MKRGRDPVMDMSIKQATVSDNTKIFYDCPYPGCGVRASRPHNLDKHVQAHVEKDKKKQEMK
jgi:hypothetical protein